MRKMPLWAVILTDFLALAVILLTFCYFHHVRPNVVAEVSEVSIDNPHRLGGDSSAPEETEEPSFPDESEESSTAVIEISDDTTSEETTEEPPVESSETSTTPTYRPATTEITERRPTEYVYESDDINVTVTELLVSTRYGQSVCHFADIRISYAENLQTVLAQNKFGTVREDPVSMAERVNAIVAINGDYYGNSSEAYGAVIRNGVLYNKKPDNPDVFVMYTNGSMKAFDKASFDADTEMSAGAYQSWDFGPSLLDADGNPYSNVEFGKKTNLNPANPRSVIGYFEPGHYCFVTVNGRGGDGQSVGLRMEDLAKLMSDLGCKAAYNLDGGATSALIFRGKVINSPCNGNARACSDLISIVEFE
ncbi:MAG: phosphodiester glycosidase family protein [Clostridiales bacterium]|nr:phosphodiester glycosidase family protein [Candidatus Coliplasma caballi]